MPAASRHLLAGRGSELARLDALLSQTAPDQLRAVVLAGEAGVGKSRLVTEFLDQHSEARRIVTHCLELGTEGLPFAPFAGLLRALVAELGREAITDIVGDGAAELARLAPGLGPPGPESRWGQGRLFEAFARLLMSLPEPRTTILVIEDIHWADPSTLDLLRFLTATLSGAPLLVVVTYRSDELPRHHPLTAWLAEYERSPRVSRIELQPLDEDAVLQILAARAGLSDADRTAIAAISQGIPFYVEELAAAYAAGNKYMPNALRSALTARASRLSPPAWDLATAASVAMSPVPHEVLLEVCGGSAEEFDRAVAEALDAGVLTVDRHGRFTFRHDLTRQALADGLLPGRRSALNARFARAWEPTAKGRSAEIARHWARANDAERTAYWSLRAADEAAEMSGREEELRHLERLLGLPREVWPNEAGTAPDLLARAAGAAADAGFSRRAEELLTLGLAEVEEGDTERLVTLTIARVRLPLVEIDFPELDRLLPLTLPGTVQRARILAVIASGLMVGDVLEEGLATAQTALAEAERAGDPLILSHVENTIGCLLLASGDESGLDHFQRSFALAEAAGSVSDLMRYYINLSAQLLVIGRYAHALEVARQGRVYAQPRGLWTGPGAFLAWQEADALLMLGNWDEAVDVCAAGLHGRPAEGAQAHLLWTQAVVAARRGEVARALELSAEMERRMEVVADRSAFVLPRAELAAELAAAQGRFAEALLALREGAAQGHDIVADHSAHLALLWSAILAASGSAPADDPALRAFLADLAQRHPTWSTLPAVLLEGDPAQRLVLLDRVDAHGCPPYQAALLRLLCADRLLRAGQRELARPHVRRANALLEPLRAATLEGWRRRLAAASGADSRLDIAGREGLTPRELEVLELIARGMSNRQIAAELFISVKTTSVHVSNILAKLGVASRTQAAAQWHAWQG